MSDDTVYCGDSCNHTGPHRYRPTAADLHGIVTDTAWAEGHRRAAHTLDLDSPEAVERLARALHASYERDPAAPRIYYADLSDSERGMWRHHAAAVLALIKQDTPTRRGDYR